MTFRIPSQGRLSQPNSSDISGNLFQTRNIDLDEEGYIKLASASISIFSEANDADFRSVNSVFHGSSIYFVGSDLFRQSPLSFGSALTNSTAVDTTPPSPGPENDGVYFNGTEVVSDGDTFKYNTSGTWTTIAGTPTAGVGTPSVLSVFPAQNSCLFGRGNKVARVNTSWTVAQTLELPTDYRVLSITENGNYAYIVTRHVENGEAALFLWTGVNTTNDGSFGVGTYGIQAIQKYQSTVALVDTLGRLLQFNGSGFTELASLPVYYTRSNWGDANNDYANIGNRGMVVDGDLITLNITNEIESINERYLSNMLGGIWCYDPKVGLYQKYSGTNNTIISDTAVDAGDINTTTNIITVSGIIVPPTGSPVFYKDGGTLIGGLIDEHWYYTIYVSDTTFKLAETYENAMNGTAIDLTSTSASNDFHFVKSYDYGLGVNDNAGSILVLNNTEYNTKQMDRTIFTTDAYSTSGTTQIWRLCVPCPIVKNIGYFITPKMFAVDNKDTFNSLTLRFKPLKYGDKIKIKYRTNEKIGFPCLPKSHSTSDNLISWTSSTTFTTPSSPTQNYYDFSNVEKGDEVEIINGSGSGFIAHVSSITQSGYQYTVTLDEANPFYVASDTSMVKIDNWTLLDTIDYTYEDGQKTVAVDSASGWCQFKIIMEGTGVTIYDNVVDNKAYSHAR